MLYDLLVIYLGGWAVVSIGLISVTSQYSDLRSPARHPMWLGVVAGAVWPLLVLGILELSSLAVWAKAQSHRSSDRDIFA